MTTITLEKIANTTLLPALIGGRVSVTITGEWNGFGAIFEALVPSGDPVHWQHRGGDLPFLADETRVLLLPAGINAADRPPLRLRLSRVRVIPANLEQTAFAHGELRVAQPKVLLEDVPLHDVKRRLAAVIGHHGVIGSAANAPDRKGGLTPLMRLAEQLDAIVADAAVGNFGALQKRVTSAQALLLLLSVSRDATEPLAHAQNALTQLAEFGAPKLTLNLMTGDLL